MRIYLRKIDEQCINKQISYPKDILKEFFDGRDNHDEILCEGSKSHHREIVRLLLATDPRFDTGIKRVLAQEGDYAVGDIMIMYKYPTKYVVELIKPSDLRYNAYMSLFADNDRHLLANINDPVDDTPKIFPENVYGIHIKKTNSALSENNPHICIGWSKMGDLSHITTKDELAELYDKNWQTDKAKSRGQCIGQIWRFYNEMKVGDYIVFADGDYCHIGRVESEYYYDNTEYPDQDADYKSTRKVKWLKKNIKRSDISNNFHRSLMTSMSIFGLNDYKSVIAELLCGTYIAEDTEFEVDESTIPTETSYLFLSAKGGAKNMIVYGTPGCGKSFYVENELLVGRGVRVGDRIRTTFFTDYSNTDFVGQVLPKINQDGSVTYEFNPGPFTLALRDAIENPDVEIALIIEELNRGNAASIFGDIFQLLDRDENGRSRYFITNVNIQDYLNKYFNGKYYFDKIAIPGNLLLVATMNTSDQNVFTLDTAFKRRWHFEKIKNKFTEDHAYRHFYIPGMSDVTWEQLVTDINQFIVCRSSGITSEDKQLGVYFIDKATLCETKEECGNGQKINQFAYKLFEYLWDDVAKFGREDWFASDIRTLDDLIEEYKRRGRGVFVEGVLSNGSNQ